MEHEQPFHYTYIANQQQEIVRIRKQYLPVEEDKMAQLRRLHRSVEKTARIWALTVGILGTLILGTGMSFTMTELGHVLGAYQEWAMVIGIFLGLLGMMLIVLAYPIYNAIVKRRRKAIAPQILKLTEELLQQ